MYGTGGLGILIFRSSLGYSDAHLFILKIFSPCVSSTVISTWYTMDNKIGMVPVFILIGGEGDKNMQKDGVITLE